MWLCLRDGFLSIVHKAPCGPNELLIRARRKGDIEKIFPGAKVRKSTTSDYLYRAVVPKPVVMAAIADQVSGIDYANFKDSVQDNDLHDAYLQVWRTMADLQNRLPYGGPNPKYIAD
jgi:hypothetical protein